MNRTVRIILAVLIPIALIVLIIVARRLGESAAAIPDNPADIVGNTAGNIYNGGSFCEADGLVYFSNPYDGGSIYVMNPDQSDIHKLITADASYINVAGDYIYYCSASSAGQAGLGYVRNGRGIYRVDKRGKKNILLKQTATDGMLLYGNTLFYSGYASEAPADGSSPITLNALNIRGENDRVLVSSQLKLGSAGEGSVYYAGMDADHHLYALDALSGSSREVSAHNMYEPVVQNGMVYFLDMDNDMHLSVWSMYDNSVRVLSEERIESFNMYGDMIYYQTIDESGNNNYAFKRIRSDGSGEELLRSGVVKDVQLTSAYVYFKDFNADLPIYQIPTYGGSISSFDAAMNAVELP